MASVSAGGAVPSSVTALRARMLAGLADQRAPLFIDSGAGGELLVARVRILLLVILLWIQLVPAVSVETRRVTLPLNVVALVLALLFYSLASRLPRPWMDGFASSAADVTLVSCGLSAFLLLDQPHAAVNNWTLFEVYFLATACASLRYNAQACALAGLLAVAEYAAIVAYAAARWNLNDARYVPFKYGMFDWHIQGLRLILLAAAGLVSALIVLRTQRLRHLSDTDRITGAATRPAFEQQLAAEASRGRRHGRPFAVALVGIDGLRRVNTTGGHAKGNAVLQSVASLLRRSVREADTVARFGGDEFALLLPETTAELVVGRLENFCEAAARAGIIPRGGRKDEATGVTLSIGVASWPDDGQQIDDVMATVNDRLRAATERGGSRIVGSPRVGSAVASEAADREPRAPQ